MKSLLPVIALGLLLAAIVFGARCSQQRIHEYEMRRQQSSDGASNPADPAAERQMIAQSFPDTIRTPAGWRYRILRNGDGAKPVAGDRVSIHYVVRLMDGTLVDSSRDRESPFAFTIGSGEVIPGWDEVLPTMRSGEIRLVVIPSSLAYGEQGRPPVVPTNAPLVFEMELLGIN